MAIGVNHLLRDVLQQGPQDEPRRASGHLCEETIGRVRVGVEPHLKGHLRRFSRSLQLRHEPGLFGDRPDLVHGQCLFLLLNHQAGKFTERKRRRRCRSHWGFSPWLPPLYCPPRLFRNSFGTPLTPPDTRPPSKPAGVADRGAPSPPGSAIGTSFAARPTARRTGSGSPTVTTAIARLLLFLPRWQRGSRLHGREAPGALHMEGQAERQ